MLLQVVGVLSHDTAIQIFNFIICGEIVVAAIANAIAFTYEPFINVTEGKQNVFKSVAHVINGIDVLVDA